MHTAGPWRCLLFPTVENQPQKTAAHPACRTVAQLRALSGAALPWHLASAYRAQLSPPRRGLSLSSGTSVLLDLRAGSPGQLPGPREAGAHGAPADYFIPGQPFFFFLLPSFYCCMAALEIKFTSVSCKGQDCLAVSGSTFLKSRVFQTEPLHSDSFEA